MNDQINTQLNISNLFKNNKKKIVSFFTLIILSIFIFVIYSELQKKNNIKISEEFNLAKIQLANNNTKSSKDKLILIIKKKNTFYSPSALNLIIDYDLIEDENEVIEYFDLIISMRNLDVEMKNLFIIKKIYFLGNKADESILLTNLNPIIQSNSIWKQIAQDYMYKFYLSKNELDKAKEFKIN